MAPPTVTKSGDERALSPSDVNAATSSRVRAGREVGAFSAASKTQDQGAGAARYVGEHAPLTVDVYDIPELGELCGAVCRLIPRDALAPADRRARSATGRRRRGGIAAARRKRQNRDPDRQIWEMRHAAPS